MQIGTEITHTDRLHTDLLTDSARPLLAPYLMDSLSPYPGGACMSTRIMILHATAKLWNQATYGSSNREVG